MKVTDYWPLAREYLIWNAAVATLQFWMADLEAHVLSSTIKQVYNAFFTPHQCTYNASNLKKFYLVTSCPHLMQPLKANSHWKTKDMRVEVKISTYPLLSDIHPGSTMFPVMTTSPLIPLLNTVQLPASHIANLCDGSYHSVHLMMK